MDIGMLWIDDGQERDLASRVAEAAASYEALYGVTPSLCLLSDKSLDERFVKQFDEHRRELNGLRFETSPSLLPNYFWIGQEEPQQAPLGARAKRPR